MTITIFEQFLTLLSLVYCFSASFYTFLNNFIIIKNASSGSKELGGYCHEEAFFKGLLY